MREKGSNSSTTSANCSVSIHSGSAVHVDLVPVLLDLLEQGLAVQIRVTGRSMRPFLQGGEAVILRHVHPRAFAIGDLVLFHRGNNKPILHRIVRINSGQRELQTKGDGLRFLDSPVNFEQIIGRVEQIHFALDAKQMGGLSFVKLDQPRQRMLSALRAYFSLFGLYWNRLHRRLRAFKGL